MHPDRRTDRRSLHLNVMTESKITNEQQDALDCAWAFQRDWSQRGDEDSICFLELRSRIERLELGAGIFNAVNQEMQNNAQLIAAQNQIKSLLIQKICDEIAIKCDIHVDNEFWEHYADVSSIAICKVVEWLKEQGCDVAANQLELEVNQ